MLTDNVQKERTLIEEVQYAYDCLNAAYEYEKLNTDLRKGSYRCGYHIGQLNALSEATLRLRGMIERHGPKAQASGTSGEGIEAALSLAEVSA